MEATRYTSAEVTVEIVKGCTRHGTVKGHRERVVFAEVHDSGVKVRFKNIALWISGNRRYLPTLEPGQEFNLHWGDPTRKTRIRIVA